MKNIEEIIYDDCNVIYSNREKYLSREREIKFLSHSYQDCVHYTHVTIYACNIQTKACSNEMHFVSFFNFFL